jgi:NAD+ synthase
MKDSIIDWTRRWFQLNGGTDAILGISGGKDSTVTAAILAEALGTEHVHGVMMPNGVQTDIDDSKRVIEALGIRSYEVNIWEAWKGLLTALPFDHTNEQYDTNTPARLRMTVLYGMAALIGKGCRVVNTGNLSEATIGWTTYGGDSLGDVSLLGGLTVTEVYKLGSEFEKLPRDLVYKVPSDGMCGSSDEAKFGFSYALLDTFIRQGSAAVTPENYKTYEKVLEMKRRSAFKRANIHLPTFDPGLPVNI